MARWGDVGAGEEQLQLWLAVGEVVKWNAGMVVRGMLVPQR